MPLRRRTALILQDNLMSALDIAQALRERNCEILGPASSVAHAMDLLDGTCVDFAVVDVVTTRDEPAAPVVNRLARQATPMILVANMDRADWLKDIADAQVTHVPKPVVVEDLLAAIFAVVEDGENQLRA